MQRQAAGWFRAFIGEPRGVVQIPSGPEVRVRAKRVRGERLLDAIDAAYGKKYKTPASQKWVRGFAEPERRATTVEFVPRLARHLRMALVPRGAWRV